MRKNKIASSIALTAGSALMSLGAAAMPVNGTGDLVSNVIFGTGNANGSFTGVNTSSATGGPDNGPQAGVELALRGKLRYDNRNAPLPGGPAGIYNYDGVKTYTFSPADGIAPGNRSVFNIDWSVNSDPNGASQSNLDSYVFGLFFDYDPSAATSFVLIDSVFPEFLRDHSFGTNSTAQSGGAEAGDVGTYETLRTTNNVAQNSWNAGFGAPSTFDPQTQGIFSAQLSAFSASQFGSLESYQDPGSFANAFSQADPLATAEIDIVFGEFSQGEVPVPAPIALLGLGLTALGALRRRRA